MIDDIWKRRPGPIRWPLKGGKIFVPPGKMRPGIPTRVPGKAGPREGVRPAPPQGPPPAQPAVPVAPPPPVPPSTALPGEPAAPVTLPGAPGTNPFDSLPWPEAGQRIRADDFRALSQGLTIIRDTFALSAVLFGRTFGEAKLALATQQYAIHRVMSVFGSEIDDATDPSLDSRKVIQVLPAALGEREVMVVVTEAVDTRRFVPNLVGLTYPEAVERMRALLGDVAVTGTSPASPQLVGLSLSEARRSLEGQG